MGTVALHTPAAAVGEPLSWIDALFTATSATCVTGLVVVDTGSRLSGLGQGIVLALIQVGGLGITMFSTLILVLLGRRIHPSERAAIIGFSGRRGGFDIKRLATRVILTAIGFELVGAVLLFATWPGSEPTRRLYAAVFHSVSAFNNAGFSTYADNLVGLQGAPSAAFVIMTLVVIGGLGFPVLWEIQYAVRKRMRRQSHLISVHTKVVLTVTAVLLIVGTVSIVLLDGSGALSQLDTEQRWVAAAFHSVSARTAGFNTVAVADFHAATLFILLMLMFVGGSPGSTAGGVKTTTLGILLAFVRSRARGRDGVDLYRRTVCPEDVRRAVAVVAAACSILVVGILVLLVAEDRASAPVVTGILGGPGAPLGNVEPLLFFDLMFEAVSALGTVGLSTGITPMLGPVGRIAIIVLMFAGRIGPLTIAVALGSGARHDVYRYPEARVMTG